MPKDVHNENTGIVLTLNSISSTGLVYTVDNQTEEVCTYGEEYVLEKRVSGTWCQIETKADDVVWKLIQYQLNPSEHRSHSINWEYLYGVLDCGYYRITLTVNENTTISAEYKIDQ